ncbi:hypothetical protein [Streptomyces sp. URMC 125]
MAYNVPEYAVEREVLPPNPMGKVRRKRGRQPVQQVDRRTVVNPR